MAENKTIFELLQEIRYELTKIEMKKSGYNAYGKFKYFQLEDFLNHSTKLFYEKGLCPIFSIIVEPNTNVEYAVLTIMKGPESIQFKMPTADPNNSSNPIQNQGSKSTYMRRYLYLNALDLTESDVVDAVAGSENDKKINYATKFQVDKLSQNKELMIDKFKELNIKTVNDIKALTLEQASELIKELETRLVNGD